MNIAKQLIADSMYASEEPKKRRRCQEACEDHAFWLVAYVRRKINMSAMVSFCPKIPRGNQPPESAFPEFNQDRLYFTSAFVLGIDKRALEQNKKEELI